MFRKKATTMKRTLTLTIHALASAALISACGGQQKADAVPTAAPSSAAPAASAMPIASASGAPVAAAASPSATPRETATPPAPLIITIEPRSGSKLKGTAKFEASPGGVDVTVDISGAPAGKHGAHIHQNADCSAKDAKSAGDHFNPEAHEHGLPPTDRRHLGDLGNLEVGKDGKGHLEIMIPGANLNRGDKMSFIDRGIVIHEKVDNGGQPAGNAGNRIGCGEIKPQ
jgi:superoxide dismutase, Cu-Zn family